MGGRLEPTPRRHAGVVAEHVHGAERLERARGERLHLSEIRDVGAHGQRLDAERLRRPGHRGHLRLVEVGDDDVGALARESQHQRAANAAGAAGHHRDLAS